MKIKKLLLGALLLFCVNSFSQVGIGTTTPTKELDVNGNTRIRGLSNSVGKTVLRAARAAIRSAVVLKGHGNPTRLNGIWVI